MPDLSGLSEADLYKAEVACERLLELHDDHQLLDGELPAELSTLLAHVRMIQQDRVRKPLGQAADHADPARAARMLAHVDAQLASMPQVGAANAVIPARLLAGALGDPAVALTDEQVNTVIQLAIELVNGTPLAITAPEITSAMLTARFPDGPPPGCLTVVGLEEVAWQELAARRAWLIAAIAVTKPGADLPDLRAAALALAALVGELDTRARNYTAYRDSPRWCSCGFECRGLAVIEDHLDQFQDPNDHAHFELTRPPGNDADHTPGAYVGQE